MASRRQRQLQRKYNSYRRYTAQEDVSYLTHSTRSAYRSESVTSTSSAQGRNSSTEIVTGSETRSYPVYIAIQNFTPDESEAEAVTLEQGQIVEVLENSNPAAWLVRTKARPPKTGWVPGSYFETPTNYYKQRRRTRELANQDVNLTPEQQAILKREQVYHDLLQTEEKFVDDLRGLLDNYIQAFQDINIAGIQDIVLNITELYNFHANIMLKGLQYYSDDPGKVGQTFVRLEKDFQHHVEFLNKLPEALKVINENEEISNYLKSLSDKVEAGSRSYIDYLNDIPDRISKYEDYFREIIKYSARANCSTKSMQKALELIQSVPRRAQDLSLTNKITKYPGEISRLGGIVRHEDFDVWEDDGAVQDRHVFLFKNMLLVTRKDNDNYEHILTIRLDKYIVRQLTSDEDCIVFRAQEQGLPNIRLKKHDPVQAEFTRKAWLKDLQEMPCESLLLNTNNV
ncbi:unnamed protein product [Bursaphelenchus okinawaensis]|uniref:SH3 domain-containing protein n=1 Tax=Bursaphelenchus okinawaensis TaxID=465554 RepID=A0A811JUG5_9BILA|nr:unnamed protein product [Bursaphelenchus okinawaensis]CAG9084468.1 unnamed protein product [Bursaphelenchus okinawaensis]